MSARRDSLFASLGDYNRKRSPQDGRSRWQALPQEQRTQYIARRRERRQAIAQQAPERAPEDHPQYQQCLAALEAQWQEQLAQYAQGLVLHPATGAYKNEDQLPANRRGALTAWRKGYRVSDDGVVRNPQGVVLTPGTKLSVVAGEKHHRNTADPKKRARQRPLFFGQRLLAALCFFGPQALRDEWCVWLQDRNESNLRRENVVLLTRSEVSERRHDSRRLPPYRPSAVAPTRKNGSRRAGHKLTPERAQAIRQLRDLGWSYRAIVEALTARGTPLSECTVRHIDKGLAWA